MQTATIEIKGKVFTAVVADTESSRQVGLSKTESLPQDEGMLFVFESPRDVTMNMVSMHFPLDMLFIDEDDYVIAVSSLSPGQYDTSVENVQYVLEINKGCGEGLVGEKVQIKEVSKGVVGYARRGKKFDLYKVLRHGGLFKNR